MESLPDQLERELIVQVRGGNRTAFGKLVEPFLPQLLALSRRMLGSSDEAEDALQSALASVWIARARLDPHRPVGAFLTTVTLNKCRDALRRRKGTRLFGFWSADSDQSLAADEPDAETIAADRETLTKVQAAIEQLPIKLREALVLVCVDGRTQRDAAELLGVTEKAIETRIYRARQRLRKKFDLV